jgi:hypothetical protein
VYQFIDPVLSYRDGQAILARQFAGQFVALHVV